MFLQQLMTLLFHEKFDCHIQEKPGFPPPDVVKTRMELIREEFTETLLAVDDRDLVKVADGLGDMLYVILGAATAFGIDLDPVFNEIHRTNMLKTGGGKRSDGKILKPAGWIGPDLAKILRAQGWTGAEGDQCPSE